MENKNHRERDNYTTLRFTNICQHLDATRRITLATMAVGAMCLLLVTGIRAQIIQNGATSAKVPSGGTTALGNQPCVLTFVTSGVNPEMTDPSSTLYGNKSFGYYDGGDFRYSLQQQSVMDSRRIVSVDAGCTLGTKQLETEVNKLVGQGFEVYSMGAVQPGQVVVLLRRPTLNASIQN
jgi:hypothetical protein